MISHDLKTPMRGIVTLADWITTDYADKLDEEGNEKLGLLSGRVNRMYEMVNGILEYCRIGDSKQDWVDIDLNDQIAGVIDMLDVPKHIEITIDSFTCHQMVVLE